MNNFSMVLKRADGSVVPDDFDCCADLIMWYVGCTERLVVEAQLHLIADDGRKVKVSIPNSRSTKVRVQIQPEKSRLDICAF